MMVRQVRFDDLPEADLYVDNMYLAGPSNDAGGDAIARLIPGAGNSGGFRPVRWPRRGEVRLCVLYDTGEQPDWPNSIDSRTGQVTYFGDNRHPGALHDTPKGGNALLSRVFEATHGSEADRLRVPPFLLFQKAGSGRTAQFRGLLAPGSPVLSSDEDLVAIWRSKKGTRFQNYRAIFTVLDTDPVSRSWISAVSHGEPTTMEGCPAAWRKWVEGRAYDPLIAEPVERVRGKADQLPRDAVGKAMLRAIYEHFRAKPTEFEACAVALWRFIEPKTGRCFPTRPTVDGGRDAVGELPLGPETDPIYVDFALEAKCYASSTGVGVEDTSRLISRLRHRNFGVFVTLSYFGDQPYKEIRVDQHPVALICGQDIVEVLRRRGYGTVAAVQAWLDGEFPKRW